MKLSTTRRGTAVPALVAFMVLASVSVSLAGRPDPTAAEPSASVTRAPAGRAGRQDVEGPGRAGSSPSAEAPSSDATDCAAALDGGDTAFGEQHGLDRAIQAILANCDKSPAAEGLVTALANLRANLERQNAKDHGGGQPNEHADHATSQTGTPPGQAEDTHAAAAPSESWHGQGQGAEHANEHTSTHP